MDLLDAITAYVRAAERSSFTAAARDLNVSQPHITRAVNQLEERLGTRLFQRSTRAMTLTDEGRDYLEKCRAILAALEDADQSVGRGAETLTGRLRIFAPVSLGRMWVVPRLEEFMRRHPALDVHLILDDRPRDMIEERIEVSLRVGEIAEQSLRVRHLGDVARVVVASPRYWDSRGRPTHPAELATYEALIFDAHVVVDGINMRRGAEAVDVKLKGRFHSNSSEALHEGMLHGLGLSIPPWWLVADDIASGRLERVLPDWTLIPPLPLHAAYPLTRSPTEKVRRFVDWLVFTMHADRIYGPDGAEVVKPV